MAILFIEDRHFLFGAFVMPNGFAFSFTPSGLPYIPDIALPQQLQPSLPQLQLPAYIPTLATTMPTTPSGLGYIPDIDLPQELQPVTPSGLPYIPDVSLPLQLQPPAIEQPGGILEFIGDLAGGAVDIVGGVAGTIFDVGKSILENLEVGVGVTSDIAKSVSSIIAQQKQVEAQETIAQAQKTSAEAQKAAAEAYQIKTLAAQTAEPVTIPKESKQLTTPGTKEVPLTYITPETGEAPNYTLYIGLAILALFFLGKK